MTRLGRRAALLRVAALLATCAGRSRRGVSLDEGLRKQSSHIDDAVLALLDEQHAQQLPREAWAEHSCAHAEPPSLCELVREERAEVGGLAAWRELCDALRPHIRNLTFVHYVDVSRGGTAAEVAVARATERAIEFFTGLRPRWVVRQAGRRTSLDEIVQANREAAAIVVGGGDLFGPAADARAHAQTGWGWGVHSTHLRSLRVPLLLFGLRWSEARGENQDLLAVTSSPKWRALQASIQALARSAALTTGLADARSLRQAHEAHERALGKLGKRRAISWREQLRYQPCATTLLELLRPCAPPRAPRAESPRILAVSVDGAELGPADRVELEHLAAWLAHAEGAGWRVHFVSLGASDSPLLGAVRPPLRRVVRLPRVRVDAPTAERDAALAEAEVFYRSAAVAVSTRGPGATIPWGLGVPTLVLHRRGEPPPPEELEAGRAAAPRSLELTAPAAELSAALERAHAERAQLRTAAAREQRRLAAATASNMLRFGAHLRTRLVELNAAAALAATPGRTLDALAGRHAGADVYVLGSGKSLDFVDAAFFEGRVTVGVNQVYRRFANLTYLLRKEHIGDAGSSFPEAVARAGPRTTHVVARGSSGMPNNDNLLAAAGKYAYLGERLVVFEHGCHTEICNGSRVQALPPPGQLVVSSSTITSAIHLAAHLGARCIILAGHDVGALDGEVNFRGYHTPQSIAIVWNQTVKTHKGARVTGRDAYAAWLGGEIWRVDLEADTKAVRKLLMQRHPGLLVYSLNPFTNLGLEGHRFARASAPPSLSL